jgi:hypothetical protein
MRARERPWDVFGSMKQRISESLFLVRQFQPWHPESSSQLTSSCCSRANTHNGCDSSSMRLRDRISHRLQHPEFRHPTLQQITGGIRIASFSKMTRGLTAMAINPFDILEVLVDSKGAARSQPFNHYFTGRKDDADSHLTRTTVPALVLHAKNNPRACRRASTRLRPFAPAVKARGFALFAKRYPTGLKQSRWGRGRRW